MRMAGLPLLAPMREVAGRLAIEAASTGRALGGLQMPSSTTLTPCLHDARQQLYRRKFRALGGKRYQAAPFTRNWNTEPDASIPPAECFIVCSGLHEHRRRLRDVRGLGILARLNKASAECP
ncbi:hypothetical protein LMTR13_26090 [Bradyrhizobium icense]|uniref:Uncharacterized protein n=1 Tax=Bradyrhizobium icense TaxID=1274631 RepID=A0A1B1UK49_9BRAD|nr:hypothetical protein LMTR13_26090 [Bradyrhizobium icense]